MPESSTQNRAVFTWCSLFSFSLLLTLLQLVAVWFLFFSLQFSFLIIFELSLFGLVWFFFSVICSRCCRQVSVEEGESKAQELTMMYVETSAKAGCNVHQVCTGC